MAVEVTTVEERQVGSAPAVVLKASQRVVVKVTVLPVVESSCCYAGVAGFEAKFQVGPSGVTVLALFASLLLFFLASFVLAVPVIYDRYDKLKSLAQALQVTRVSLILNGIGIFFSLITAFTTTISVFTVAGCKNPKDDPMARQGGADFVAGLPSTCTTRRAGAFFFWFTMLAWVVTMYLAFQEWRTGKTVYRPEDPPFSLPSAPPPHHNDEEDADPYTRGRRQETTGTAEEDDEYDDSRSPFADAHGGAGGGGRYGGYGNAPTGAGAGRPSMDAYGAFSDPSPSGYGGYGGGGRPVQQQQQYNQPEVSRTMQYADPYAAVRASIHTNTPPPMPQPPTYDGYPR
ncbi:hypothetical protein M408DRAFT_14272 [Serendipita vermifera MAFF 305830]|uniref:MARVEL domain-containing protein n=1 Tax=Serendipita vermifera MAFF 305830 TaxID=933852 RepID=A0A0C2X6B4_SERVB|nr:hypothetical protein M408DRAFT_14272 [Serendipita vermifera MAFF 305830]